MLAIARIRYSSIVRTAFAAFFLVGLAIARADSGDASESSAKASETGATEKKVSPWLLVPTLTSAPKLGTSLGGIAGYMHYFDPESKVSIFSVAGQYTSTESIVAALIAKTSFQADHQRLLALATGGNIKNDYDDFLGTGMPLKSEDQLRAFAARYLYRIWGDWFIGAQAVITNYVILGQSALDNETLQTLGLTGFKGGGVGAILYLDSRDSEYSPHNGWLVNVNNIAYREWIAGDNNYDSYRADIRYFWEHGSGHVLALRQNNQWTVNAPPAAFAPITLRGYKFGQYLGKNMSSFEAEERLRFARRWTATIFAGVGCLYGDDLDCTDEENIYPDGGVGVQYVIREREGMVLSLEYAKGKGDNQGVYMKFGYGF